MKSIPLILMCLVFPLSAAEETKLPELKTLDGKVYTQVTIRKVEPDGISILHESGTAKVPFEKLPEDMRKLYGFDAEAAASHRAKLNAEQINAEAAIDAELQGIANKKVDKAVDGRVVEADAALVNRVKGMARKVSIDGSQFSDIGIVAEIRVMKPVSVPVRGSMIQKENKWIFDKKEDGVIRGTRGATAGKHVDMTGRPYGLRDTSSIVIDWQGPAWRIGFIRYKTQQGLLRTCPLFTASEVEAVAFYQKHGFTQSAVDAVRKVD